MADTPKDVMPIRLVTLGADGKQQVLEISPESFVRLEIDVSHQQTVWVEGPRPYWYLNGDLFTQVLVMGGPGAIAHIHSSSGNAWLMGALRGQKSDG